MSNLKTIEYNQISILNYAKELYNVPSFRKLAKATGWAEETLSRIMNGKRNIPLSWLNKMSADHNITLEEIKATKGVDTIAA